MFKNIKLILILLFLIGGLLRFYAITKNPVSLNIDEVSIGYNAYSILKTARDEHGEFLPLSFKSVGDYKPPILIYLTVPSIALFGLNEFGVRFPVAFISSFGILIIHLFIKELTKNVKLSLIASALYAFSPWSIYFSRYSTESSLALFFILTGMFFLLKMKNGRKIYLFLSAFFLSLSMYTYHTERLFVPLLILLFFFLNRSFVFLNKGKAISFLAIYFLFSFPLILSILFGQDKTRVQSTFITTDINFYRNVLVKDEVGDLAPTDYAWMFFYWARKFLNYFQPSFLFHSGLNLTKTGTFGLGVLYLFELPFLALALFYLIKNKTSYLLLIFGWIVLGILPASLTNNEQHALRTLVILPMLLLISAVGIEIFLKLINDIKHIQIKIAVYSISVILIIWNLTFALLVYSIHFPKQQGEAFMEGTKEAVEYALSNKEKYDKIIFDPVRGIQGPYISSIPHEYVLFYSKYDPVSYQPAKKRLMDGSFSFDKFEFRSIDWSKDSEAKNVLLIGSPWSLPEKELKEEEILEKVYLSGGQLAFLIVSPRRSK